ncbi:hypothetical protein GCM10010417_19050 [Streptomyces carpaticus]
MALPPAAGRERAGARGRAVGPRGTGGGARDAARVPGEPADGPRGTDGGARDAARVPGYRRADGPSYRTAAPGIGVRGAPPGSGGRAGVPAATNPARPDGRRAART